MPIIQPHLLQTIYTLTIFHGSRTACTYTLFVTKLSVIIAQHSQSAAEKFERLLPIISCQVDPDQLIQTLQDRPALSHKHHIHTRNAISSITPYSSRYSSQQEISKFKIPQDGAPADAVHQMLKDELDLDGRPNLNLARSSIAQLFGMIECALLIFCSFVGTYMEREAEALMIENLSKKYVTPNFSI